jgi:hypothetical protein
MICVGKSNARSSKLLIKLFLPVSKNAFIAIMNLKVFVASVAAYVSFRIRCCKSPLAYAKIDDP